MLLWQVSLRLSVFIVSVLALLLPPLFGILPLLWRPKEKKRNRV